MKTVKFNSEKLKKLNISEMNRIKGGDTIVVIIDGVRYILTF